MALKTFINADASRHPCFYHTPSACERAGAGK